jgi:hypothetical protein
MQKQLKPKSHELFAIGERLANNRRVSKDQLWYARRSLLSVLPVKVHASDLIIRQVDINSDRSLKYRMFIKGCDRSARGEKEQTVDVDVSFDGTMYY